MKLSRVSLQNFRNYEQAEVQITADLVLILGDNASGKTNFLESLYFLSRLKSFHSPDDLVVRHGADHFDLDAAFGEDKLSIVVQKDPILRRAFKTNDLKVKRGFWQAFPVVLFVPSDLNLFSLGPQLRRKFLDETISQKDQSYSVALQSLDHILKQKAALLENLNAGIGALADLDFWNEQLSEVSAIVASGRQRLMEFINKKINPMQQRLMGNGSLAVEFKTQVNSNLEEFLENLRNHREAEIRSRSNLIGPHRDDFVITKDSILNIHNCSRGELRIQILSLKLLQAEYLSAPARQPIILLDDVFSELDETRRTKLLETLSGYQIFITSTEEHHLPKVVGAAQVLKVQNNQIG